MHRWHVAPEFHSRHGEVEGRPVVADLRRDLRSNHLLSTRTVSIDLVFDFLYMNMDHHIEHHMFAMVPFYALPRLHTLICSRCPKSYANLREAYAEIVPALRRQRRDPSWFVVRPLPEAATADRRLAYRVTAE